MIAFAPILGLALPSFDGLGKIVVFLVMLSVLVVLHEAGHFLVARWNGVRVNDFAVGFGPTLLKWTSPRSGTNYRLNLLPIGGYCAMQGEDGQTSEAEQQREYRERLGGSNAKAGAAAQTGGTAVAERVAVEALPIFEPAPVPVSKRGGAFRAGAPGLRGATYAGPPGSDNFQAKTPWQRLAIIVAGPIANFILAFVILLFAAVTFGIASPTFSTKIGPLSPGSPGAKAGLEIGDEIVAIDGVRYTSGDKLVAKIQGSAGVPLHVSFLRHGATQVVVVTPQAVRDGNKTVGRIGFIRIPEFQRVGFFQAIPVAGAEFANALTSQLTGYGQLIRHPKEYGASVSGPIGMERAASAYQDLGWGPYLDLAAMISVALGLLNLLPFPALDGGRAVFIIAEMLRGRPVEPEKEAFVHVTGFAVLITLMVFVAYHDISNIVSGKGVF
jgi:regulator of sigma E protease